MTAHAPAPLSLADAAKEASSKLSSILFTVTALTPDGAEVSRIYSTHPEIYAVGGRKRLDPSQTSPLWRTQVVEGQQAFVGPDRAALREFFFDWATIESLGCGAIVNTPVVVNGETIASINFLGSEGSLSQESVAVALDITERATAAVAEARAEAFPEVAK